MRLLPYLCISDTARPKCSFAEFYAESRAFPAVEGGTSNEETCDRRDAVV